MKAILETPTKAVALNVFQILTVLETELVLIINVKIHVQGHVDLTQSVLPLTILHYVHVYRAIQEMRLEDVLLCLVSSFFYYFN